MDNTIPEDNTTSINKENLEISPNVTKNDLNNDRTQNKRNTVNYKTSESQEIEKPSLKNNNKNNKINSTKENPKISFHSMIKGYHSHSSENLRKLDDLNNSNEKNYASDDEDEKINNKLSNEKKKEENNEKNNEKSDEKTNEKNNEKENNNKITENEEKNKNKIHENFKIIFNSRGKNLPEDDDIQSCHSSTINSEFELSYYKNPDVIRNAYFSQLIAKRIWAPTQKPKTHNSLIIFDWDDTLLPTSFLAPGGVFNENLELSEKDMTKVKKLEESVLKLLNMAKNKGDVFIITNAGVGWVEFSAEKFYPSILEILKKIEIISARSEYEDKFPGDSRRWKIQTFLNLQKKLKLNLQLVTNIICLGDSVFEMEAGRILASKFTQAFIKTIKFREKPKPEELQKQLSLVIHKFDAIYSSVKNLTVRVEKKKKKDE